jgi:hypothetical protein
LRHKRCGAAGVLSDVDRASNDALRLVLFHRRAAPAARIVPGNRWRDWMSATDDRHANRCLPLLMANQTGWVLLNPAPFTATWDGSDRGASLEVEYPADVPAESRIAKSHFGYGILTFVFDDLIQTPPGYNLLVRGPTNSPKDGICALDGLVETDWSAAPFTMNWKLTRPGTVSFAKDEPFCQIIPQRRGELERFGAELRTLSSEPQLAKRFKAWSAYRSMVEVARRSGRETGDAGWRRLWMPDYFKGTSPSGESSPGHQTTLRLASFADGDG